MELKYEFDTIEEYNEAMKHLEDYHDCEKCHNKIVMITSDEFGNTRCGYCGAIVKYPQMKREAFKKWLKERISANQAGGKLKSELL